MSTDTSTKPTSDKTTTDMYGLFTKSNIIILLWFFAIYIVISFIIGLSSRDSSTTAQDRMLSISRSFDFISLSFLVIFLVAGFFLKTETDKENIVKDTYELFIDFIDNSTSFFSTGLFILAFYIVIMLSGIPMDYLHKPLTISLIEGGAWLMFSIVLIVAFFKYVLKISVADFLEKIFNDIWNKPKDPSGNAVATSSTITNTNEVFNVSNNIYTYQDAKAVCKAYDSRLATYDEIETAYTKGGEWCNYGWSEKQYIYFPTQKQTWQKLQTTDTHKNDCGRPGVNGGFIANPNTRFGVNCYGKKPNPTKSELGFMDAKKNQPIPKTAEETLVDLKVKLFKDHSDKLMVLNGFNSNQWSSY